MKISLSPLHTASLARATLAQGEKTCPHSSSPLITGHATATVNFRSLSYWGNLIFIRDVIIDTQFLRNIAAPLKARPAKQNANAVSNRSRSPARRYRYHRSRLSDRPFVVIDPPKDGGELKIVNKSFYAEPKTAPAEAKKPSE